VTGRRAPRGEYGVRLAAIALQIVMIAIGLALEASSLWAALRG
jgi:hypothetical protein